MPLAIPYKQGRESMLKITTHTDTLSTTLQLEGRLAGPWVGELKRCWLSTVSAKTRHPLSLDLSAVTYVDAEGKELLSKIYQAGAKLIASGCLTSCLVREITQAVRSGERKK
jgi:anti-anti-sigma regulatory factor